MFALIAALFLFLAFLADRGADLGLGVAGWVLLAGVAFALHHAFAIPVRWRQNP